MDGCVFFAQLLARSVFCAVSFAHHVALVSQVMQHVTISDAILQALVKLSQKGDTIHSISMQE